MRAVLAAILIFLGAAGTRSAAAAPSWWDGFAGSGLTGCVHALAFHDGQLVAGGSITVATPEGQAHAIVRWDGSAWHPMGAGLNGVVHALALYDGELYAGGSLYGVGGGDSFGIARWDGTQWVGLGRGTDGGAIYALRAYDGWLYAGGAFSTVGEGVPSPRIARWNGETWSPVGSGTDGVVRALEVYGGELWVGGEFQQAGGLDAARLARWGSAFGWAAAPGTALDGVVGALCVHEGDLVIGGSFSRVNHAISSPNVARFNYATWTWNYFYPFGGGPGPVFCLASHGAGLAAGGGFGAATGWPYEHVALAQRPTVPGRTNWWNALESGLDGDVYALASDGTFLYAGGCFAHAGGLESPGIARWGEIATAGIADPRAGWSRLLRAGPNPFGRDVRVTLASARSGPGEIAVYDLQGRVVTILYRGALEDAPGALLWDGRHADGEPAGAGVYFLRLTSPGRVETTRLVRTR